MFIKYGDVPNTRNLKTLRLPQGTFEKEPQNIIEYALTHPGSRCAWYAPQHIQALNAFRDIRNTLFDEETESVHSSSLEIRLKNGSIIKCFSEGSLESIRGLLISYLGITSDVSSKDRVYTDILVRAILGPQNGHIWQASRPTEQARMIQ